MNKCGRVRLLPLQTSNTGNAAPWATTRVTQAVNVSLVHFNMGIPPF
jgi:hypothetical protein